MRNPKSFSNYLNANAHLYQNIFTYIGFLYHQVRICEQELFKGIISMILNVRNIDHLYAYPRAIDQIHFAVEMSYNMTRHDWVSVELRCVMLYLLVKKIKKKRCYKKIKKHIRNYSPSLAKETLKVIKRVDAIVKEFQMPFFKYLITCKVLNIYFLNKVKCSNRKCNKYMVNDKYNFNLSNAEINILERAWETGNLSGSQFFEQMVYIFQRWEENQENNKDNFIKWKKCSKCHLKYCSKKCFKYDWNRYNHRLHCKELCHFSDHNFFCNL